MGIEMSLDLIQLGERIRYARERVGLSQEQLASELNRDQRTISQYENGKRKILVTDLPLLAKILRVPISYFFEEENFLDDYDKQLLLEFHRIYEDVDKATIVEIVRLFSDTIERKNA
jgi:transcriptional regulator with XRE-family HTH domain